MESARDLRALRIIATVNAAVTRPTTMRRLVPRSVEARENEGQDDLDEEHDPAEPCECYHGVEESAGLELRTEGW